MSTSLAFGTTSNPTIPVVSLTGITAVADVPFAAAAVREVELVLLLRKPHTADKDDDADDADAETDDAVHRRSPPPTAPLAAPTRG